MGLQLLTMLGLCSTATRAAPGGTSGTGSSSALGTLPRAAEGVPLAFFFFGISPAVSVSTFLFFFFFLSPFCFFSGGALEVMDPGSSPWSLLHLTVFFFPSPGRSDGLVFLAFFFLVVLSDVDPSAPFSESFRCCFLQGPTKSAGHLLPTRPC